MSHVVSLQRAVLVDVAVQRGHVERGLAVYAAGQVGDGDDPRACVGELRRRDPADVAEA